MHIVNKDHLKNLESFYQGTSNSLHQLEEFDHSINEKRQTFLGYPCNASIKLSEFFKWWENSSISKSPLNDVGDPFTDPLYTLNTRPFERSVLEFFATLFSIKPYWGYVTSGGTQGNEQGLYMGREFLSKYGKPILYVSSEAHYSIVSLGRLLNIETCVIPSQSNGEINYTDLTAKLNAQRPALFSLSIGTTFKGAIDRIEIIDQIVKEKGIKHVYYHADAALFGGYLPFYSDPTAPDLNFEQFPYDSIAVSGHKFFGSPIPMGIFLIRQRFISIFEAQYIQYIDTRNLTIPCSRSALNTLIFWWLITTTPLESFVEQTNAMMENARYLYTQLSMRQYPAWLNPYSNTVYFKAPPYSFCKHWCLSLMTCPYLGNLAHAVIMQHASKTLIDQFLHELDEEISKNSSIHSAFA